MSNKNSISFSVPLKLNAFLSTPENGEIFFTFFLDQEDEDSSPNSLTMDNLIEDFANSYTDFDHEANIYGLERLIELYKYHADITDTIPKPLLEKKDEPNEL